MTTNSHCHQVSSLRQLSSISDMDSVRSTYSGSTVSAENQEDKHQSICILDTIAQLTLNILSGCQLAEKDEKQNLIKEILCENPNLNFMGESLDREATTFFNVYGQLSDSQQRGTFPYASMFLSYRLILTFCIPFLVCCIRWHSCMMYKRQCAWSKVV